MLRALLALQVVLCWRPAATVAAADWDPAWRQRVRPSGALRGLVANASPHAWAAWEPPAQSEAFVERDLPLPPADLVGDPTCMRWTGLFCNKWDNCAKRAGKTICEDGTCLCAPGYCSDVNGHCVSEPGKWIGDYSMRFEAPFLAERPFVGVSIHPTMRSQVPGYLANLAADSDDSRSWTVVLTGHQRVRLVHKQHPTGLLTFYDSRRRANSIKLLQDDDDGLHGGHHSAAASTATLPDSDDIMPVLVSLEFAKPQDVTFEIRPAGVNGKHIEIWCPNRQVTLATANPEWVANDAVAAQGVAECKKPFVSRHLGVVDCEDRNLIVFDPPLPTEAHFPMPGISAKTAGLGLTFVFVPLCIAVCWLPCCFPSRAERALDKVDYVLTPRSEREQARKRLAAMSAEAGEAGTTPLEGGNDESKCADGRGGARS